jgi:hypothetical protein
MVNIFVVDQDNQPILYYATGKKEICRLLKCLEKNDAKVSGRCKQAIQDVGKK